MESYICFTCKRVILDHTEEEALLCALELSKREIVDRACGVNNQRKPAIKDLELSKVV